MTRTNCEVYQVSCDGTLQEELCLLDPFISPVVLAEWWVGGFFQTLFGPRVFHATWCSGNLD